MASTAQRRLAEYRKMRPHLMAVVAMEYLPTGHKKWPYKCSACKASAKHPNPPLARYHDSECAWLNVWQTLPAGLRQSFETSWDRLTPRQQQAIRCL